MPAYKRNEKAYTVRKKLKHASGKHDFKKPGFGFQTNNPIEKLVRGTKF